MQLCYPAVFHIEDGSIWAEFPDLEGCQTFGDTIKETAINAKEALEVYACSLLERGISLPPASDIKVLDVSDADFTSLIIADMSAYATKSRAVKKTLTIPGWLNTQAEAMGLNFSKVLQNALMEQINRT